MSATITYRDGSVRILRPTDAFYRGKPEEIKNKLATFAKQTGLPNKVVLTHHNPELCMDIDFAKRTETEVSPEPVVPHEVNQERRDKKKRKRLIVKKALKKSVLNTSFTMINRNGCMKTLDDIKEERKQKRKS
jgi:hypothetical protein